MEYLRIKNWEKYQDTAGRNVRFVKLSPSILMDMEYMCLPDRERLCFLLLLAYAGVNANKFPDSPEHIMYLCHFDEKPDLDRMIDHGLLEPWSEEKHAQMIEMHEERLNRWNERKRRQRALEKVSRECHANVTPLSRTETETETETETLKPIVRQKPNHTQIVEIFDFLNQKTGKRFQAKTPKGDLTTNGKLVQNLLKKGYTPDDVRMVTARKVREWTQNAEMIQYLRPKTLFAPSNFENYMGECV